MCRDCQREQHKRSERRKEESQCAFKVKRGGDAKFARDKVEGQRGESQSAGRPRKMGVSGCQQEFRLPKIIQSRVRGRRAKRDEKTSPARLKRQNEEEMGGLWLRWR